ncbi:IS21 family transposase [Fundicoccus sp. Sow4_D5]|uniref:IS21 family transposase n=1 Tax=Fundicoccus sp. Sow4_D5 TaxID=3438782 RepID=UPI003F92EBF4
MPNYLEMVRLHEAGFSLRQIAKIVGSGRSTVTRTVNIAQKKGLGYVGLSQWSVKEIEELFRVSQKKQAITYHVMPNYEALSKDLVKPGVTMQLLWEEYAQTCRLNGQIYYQLTQFKKYFNDYLNKTRFSHILNHKAGEQIQVDWAGTRPHWVDPTTGEIIKGEFFVGTLPFSNYTYAQACVDQKSASWIDAHVNMFKFFNGVSTLLIPDNLRVSVTKHTKNELILNSTYEDMATYYQTIVVPSRVYRPKDKAAVEGHVKHLTTHLIARMRHYQCFSIQEYNHYLLIALAEFNAKPFQKKEGSRLSLFETFERETLKSLPHYPYEMCTFKDAKVYNNSHVTLNKHYYSVPYQYIGEKVTLKIYADHLEVYHKQQLVCQHRTTGTRPGAYSTVEAHLPEESQYYGQWNSTRYLKWASRIGPNTHTVIAQLFALGPEQQYYRRVHAILKMADTYSDQRLDTACHYALERSSQPNFTLIKQLIEHPMTQINSNTLPPTEQSYLRGAAYYDKFNRKN